MYPYDFHLVVDGRIVVSLERAYVFNVIHGPMGPSDAVEELLAEKYGWEDGQFLLGFDSAGVSGEGPGSDEDCDTALVAVTKKQLAYVLACASRVRPDETRIFRNAHRRTPNGEVLIVRHSLGACV